MPLHRATTYLKNVIEQKEIIPFRRFMGGVGRHAQAKVHGTSQGKFEKIVVKEFFATINSREIGWN